MHKRAESGRKMTEYVKKFEVLKIIQEAMKKVFSYTLGYIATVRKRIDEHATSQVR